jgi:hypothetical protein
MKTYRLNENWSSFSVGDRFKLSTRGNGDLFQLINNSGDYVLAKIPTDLLDEVDYDIWKPKDGETYYYCDEDGEVLSSEFYDGYAPHVPRCSLGNCFKTEEDAQAMVDWFRARHNLVESGARFINSRDINASENCFNVYFSVNERELMVNDVFLGKNVVFSRELCFDDKQLAERSIEEHKDDWLTYLGVKEKNDERTDA